MSATDSASVAESGADSMQVDAPGPLASAVATYGAHARANNNALEGDRCEGVGVASLQKADCLTMEMSPTAETDEGRKSGQTRIVPHGAERALCSDVRATYSAICQNSPGSASGKKRKQALLDSYFDTDSESDECEEADLPRSLLDDPLQSGQNAEPGPAKKKKALGSRRGTIYCIINLITGKMYVGQTVQRLSARIRKHMSNAKSDCRILKHNIKKYGKKNFKVTVLAEVAESELNEEEIKWIAKLNTLTPNGMNLTSGGDGGGKDSDETRERKSKSMKAYASRPEVRQHKRDVWASEGFKDQQCKERKLIQNQAENVGRRRASWDRKRADAIALEQSPERRREMWKLARNNARQGVRKAIRRGVHGRDLWEEFYERWLDDASWKGWVESDAATLPRARPSRSAARHRTSTR